MFASFNANLKSITLITIFDVKKVKMAVITLRNVPDETHRKIKRIQLDYEDQGIKKTLEEIYLELINISLKSKNFNK